MAGAGDHRRDPDQPIVYEIRFRGHLGPHWAARYGELEIDLDDDGVTRLTGPVTDQAALHGLLRSLRDLGVTLLSVNPIESESDNTVNQP